MRLFDACEAAFGPPRALVTNAGILEPQMRLEAMSVERVQRVLATNVIGTFLCTREAVRRISTRRGGPGGGQSGASHGTPCKAGTDADTMQLCSSS